MLEPACLDHPAQDARELHLQGLDRDRLIASSDGRTGG
jgi:hypothetical protein